MASDRPWFVGCNIKTKRSQAVISEMDITGIKNKSFNIKLHGMREKM